MSKVNLRFALAIAGMSCFSVAYGQTAASMDPKVGTTVTITGCVHEGTAPNTYVLVHVRERTEMGEMATGMESKPYAIYMLDTTAGLKPQVGQLINVTGTVTQRDAKNGTINVAVDPDARNTTKVTLKTADKTLKAKSYSPTSNQSMETKKALPDTDTTYPRPVYRLAVSSVQSVNDAMNGPACR